MGLGASSLTETIEIRASDRVMVCGKTGSGKTVFARAALWSQPNLLVIDSKGELDDWRTVGFDRTSRRAVLRGEPRRMRLIPESPGDADAAIAWAYKVGNITVYVDELYAMVTPSRIPAGLSAALTRGRSRNCSVWCGVQRPRHIPLIVLSEADAYFCFRLQLAEDRKRLAAIVGPAVMSPIPDRYGFWAYRNEWEGPQYFRSIDVSTNKGGAI